MHSDKNLQIQTKIPISANTRVYYWYASLTPELVQWVIGFGSKVKVLEPHELISTVQKEAKEILDGYDGPRKRLA